MTSICMLLKGPGVVSVLLQTYDRELENLAQIWASNCLFSHDNSTDRYIPGKSWPHNCRCTCMSFCYSCFARHPSYLQSEFPRLHDCNLHLVTPQYLQILHFSVGKYDVGQNLALGSPNWEATLQLWHSEVQNFKYGFAPEADKVIGHYTQMIWSDTTRVGCGVQLCNGSLPFYVCNYAPV